MLTAVVAGPASAFHKETCHGAGCDGSGVAGGIGTLLDANGDTIGQVVGISATLGADIAVLFEMSGHMFLATVFSGATLEFSGFKNNATVFFSELDCTGEAWVNSLTEELVVFFGEFRVAIITTDAPDERRLFHVIPGTDISMDVETKSRMNGACGPHNPTQDLFLATELDSDLHVTFPKPYSLDLN